MEKKKQGRARDAYCGFTDAFWQQDSRAAVQRFLENPEQSMLPARDAEDW